MARFGPGRRAIIAALLSLVAVGAAPVAASTGPGGGAPFAITVNPTGTVTKLGVATISGTITCDSATGTVTVFDLFAGLTQPVGRLHSVQGGSPDLTGLTCNPGSTTAWSTTVVPFAGKFVIGSAFASGSGDGCDSLTCGSTQVAATVKLASSVPPECHRWRT